MRWSSAWASRIGAGRPSPDGSAIWSRCAKDGDDWLHEAGQFRFVPDGAGCIAYAYATHFGVNPQSGARFVRSLGYFVADCVRADGRWRFRRFSVNGWDKALPPWKKPFPWDGL